VGGRKANELNGGCDDCDIARARAAVRLSPPRDSGYETSLRCAAKAAVGNERFQGTTGEVARKTEDEGSFSDVVPALFSLKSPECNADRGRSISKPIAAGSRRCSGVEMREVCGSVDEARGVSGRSCDVGRVKASRSVITSPPCRCSHDGLFVLLILSIHSFRPNMDGLRVWIGDSGFMSRDMSVFGSSDCRSVSKFLSTANPEVSALWKLVTDA